jgi:rhodanese-related sulfurtransferase
MIMGCWSDCMKKVTRPGMMQHLLATVGIGCIVMLGGCADSDDRAPGVVAGIEDVIPVLAAGEGHLDAQQLAALIMAGHEPVEVIDLRASQVFAAGHIKGARNLSLPQLLSEPERQGLGGRGVPVLISEHGVVAAQASALLRLYDIGSIVLVGGYQAWREYLRPEVGEASSLSKAAAQQRAARQAAACWFEGDYVATAGLTPRVPASATPSSGQSEGYMPPLQPAAPAQADPLGLGLGLGLGPADVQTPPPRPQLKVREGC